MTYEEIKKKCAEGSRDMERGLLAEVLSAHGWVIADAAVELKAPPSTIARAAHRVGLGERLAGRGRPKGRKAARV